MKYIQIDYIMEKINEYFPNETDESLAARISVSLDRFKLWHEKRKGPGKEFYRLIISFFESNNDIFFLAFVDDKKMRIFLEGCIELFYFNGPFFSKNGWEMFWQKIKTDKSIIGFPFNTVLEKCQAEIEYNRNKNEAALYSWLDTAFYGNTEEDDEDME